MPAKHRLVLPALGLGAALLLSACGSQTGSGSGDGPSVVASSYPFAWVTQQVAGDAVDVTNLTSPGVEPHDVELAPQQVGEVLDADLVVYEDEFQPAVDDALETADLDAEHVLDVGEVVDRIPTAEEDHADEAGHAEEEDDHGAYDPHVWLDPTIMATVAGDVAERLSEVDPGQADVFTANADALVARLERLDTAFRTGLASCERTTIVTSHEAFAYLARAYGLTQVGIAGLDPTTEPSPSDLADVTDLVRSEGVTTIFTEELVSPAVAETVAEETGAEVAVLDPVEGLSDETADEDYLSLMRANLATLQQANGCS